MLLFQLSHANHDVIIMCQNYLYVIVLTLVIWNKESLQVQSALIL